MLALILVVAAIAVARLTRILVTDRIGLPVRRWVVNRWGGDSLAGYFIHCPWCTSIWIAGIVMPAALLPYLISTQPWWVTVTVTALSIPAASHIAGMLNGE